MNITLLPNLPSFKSFSMERYHRELKAHLRCIENEQVQVEDFPFENYPFPSLRVSSKILLRLDRWMLYPLLVSRIRQRNLHILDQSHAHLALFARGCKTVVTCHDLMALRDVLGLMPVKGSTLNKRMLNLLIRGLKKADHIVAISHATKRDLIDLAGISAEKITVVYNGRNEIFRPYLDEEERAAGRRQVLQDYGICAQSKLIFHVGTGSPAKNTSTVLRALHRLPEEFVLIRAGAQLNNEEQVLARSLVITQRYRYAGANLSDDTLASLYRAADVFVFPSLWEGFGWPALEAMSCGTPVVCSNIPSLSEIVCDSGVLIEPMDDELLAAQVSSIASNDSLRRTFSTKGIERAKMFSWDTNAREVLNVYKRTFDASP